MANNPKNNSNPNDFSFGQTICPYCNKRYKKGEPYCPYCKKDKNGVSHGYQPMDEKKAMKIRIILSVVSLAALAIIWLLLQK